MTPSRPSDPSLPLKDLEISRPNPVWYSDITDIPMRRGFLSLVAIMDWAARKVLLPAAVQHHGGGLPVSKPWKRLEAIGKPEIFDTDQGSRFDRPPPLGVLPDAKVQISMDGRGRWMDNVFIESFGWRSVKYECVYLHAFERKRTSGGLNRWMAYYNTKPHSARLHHPVRGMP